MRTYLILLLSIALHACSSGDNESQQQQSTDHKGEEAATEAPNEDAVMLQLSPYLISEPSSRAEEEQNTIVNYAIDKIIPLERTNSGLFYRILETGEGENLKWGDYIKVHYKGYFLNGQVFDSSYRRGNPIEFYIGNMVAGWNEGLQLLKPGGKMLLLLPSALGYGEKGFPNGKEGYLVPPNEILVFEVEVLERVRGEE